MAPIPKRSDQLHGHRKPPKVSKAPAGRWYEDEQGDRFYLPLAKSDTITVREDMGVLYYVPVDLPPGIELEPDEEG